MDNTLNSITKAFWFRNKKSPVIFMIDDLANIYFHKHGRYNEGDWGGLLNSNNSLYCYLRDTFVQKIPDLKFTFFLVTGKREIQSVGQYDFVSTCDSVEFGTFLDCLSNDGHEIAYHGNKHGVIDDKGCFIQEWSSFESIHEANSSIQQGLEYISSSSNVKISGGKYCGYEDGQFGHQSIVDSKFSWWFDFWDSDITKRPYGELKDGVFYLPSNIDCSVYSFRLFQYLGQKKYYRSVLRQIKDGVIERKISQLLKIKGIISLQEHSSPTRTDGKTQYPNVFDDLHSINYLLKKLSQHDVWWATASEVADYSRNRDHTEIKMQSQDSFIFISDNETSCADGMFLTLILSNNIKSIKVNEQHYNSYIKDNICMVDVRVSFSNVYYLAE